MKILDILLRYVVAFLAILLLWEAGALALGPYLLPEPVDVLHAWWQAMAGPDMPGHIRSSAVRVFSAMLLAFVTAFPLGILLGCRKRIDRYLSPMVFLTYPLPKIVLLPVFLTLFGLGDMPKILLIALTCGYQILVVTRDGIRRLDARYFEAFRTLGGIVGRRQFCGGSSRPFASLAARPSQKKIRRGKRTLQRTEISLSPRHGLPTKQRRTHCQKPFRPARSQRQHIRFPRRQHTKKLCRK